MTNVATQIVELYESCGLSAEQIAESQDLDVATVKLALSQYSPKYRSALRENEETFTEDEYTAAKQAIASLLYAEDENTRLRAAKFVINEAKGRHNIKQIVTPEANFNILIINQQMAKARESLEKSKSKAPPIIDVESTNSKKAA